MSRSVRLQRALPFVVLVVVAVCDVVLGRDRVVLGLVVISPLVAATALGRRAIAGYGLLAVVTAGLLGFYDRQYAGDALPAQILRLAGVTFGSFWNSARSLCAFAMSAFS